MPTEVIHIIAADGSGDYTTLAAWQTAQARNLVTADQIAIARIRGELTLAAQFNVSGWTTDTTRYIVIEAESGQECLGRTTGEGFAKIKVATHLSAINISQTRTKIRDLYIENTSTETNGGSACQVVGTFSELERCVLITNSTSISGGGSALVATAAGVSAKFCLGLLKGTNNAPVFSFTQAGGDPQYQYNCTAIGNANSTYGFSHTVATTTESRWPVIINCVSFGSPNDFFVTENRWHTSSTHNAGTTADAAVIPGANSVVSVTTTDIDDVTYFSKSGGALNGAGFEHGVGTLDIRRETISSWSIGAAVDGAASPSISLSGVYAPGETITAVLSNFTGTPTQATLTDSANNSMVRVLTPAGNDYTFTLPDLPGAGNNTAGLLFGDITVTVNDPGV